MTPLVIYGLVMFAGGFLGLWIWPETKSLRLPYTLEECEQFASSTNTWVAKMCCRKERKQEFHKSSLK